MHGLLHLCSAKHSNKNYHQTKNYSLTWAKTGARGEWGYYPLNLGKLLKITPLDHFDWHIDPILYLHIFRPHWFVLPILPLFCISEIEGKKTPTIKVFPPKPKTHTHSPTIKVCHPRLLEKTHNFALSFSLFRLLTELQKRIKENGGHSAVTKT